MPTTVQALGRPGVAALMLLSLAACASLPTTRTSVPSYVVTDTAGTVLGRQAARALAGLQGPTGVSLMARGPDAFLARLALVAAAERAVDAQYYIWQKDTTGQLLMSALVHAADRGVRVRLLIDDFGSAANDANLMLLDSHPQIEVRLFNPIADRQHRTASMAADFGRINRRMHNKSLTADNQMTIVGGRNIGDEYFEAGGSLDYRDIDALAVGAVVADVSERFDRYWNNPVVYRIADLVKTAPGDGEAANAIERLREFERGSVAQAYVKAMAGSSIADQIRAGEVRFAPAGVRVLADDPAKVEMPGEHPETNLLPQLMPELVNVRRDLILVSPYFVPGRDGVALLRQVRQRGVRVRILTNSLASTDELPVFATYSNYRRDLLAAGIELYEINPGATRDAEPGGRLDLEHTDAHGSGRSHAALHGKVLVFDCEEFFVGSMNLDPRSAFTNTEIGFVVAAPAVAAQVCAGIERVMQTEAYRLEWNPIKGQPRVEFVGTENGRPVRYIGEPKSTGWQRAKAWFLSLLPIKPLMSITKPSLSGQVRHARQ